MATLVQEQRPSPITAEHKSPAASERYLFIPTTRVIQEMADHGWVVNSSAETRSRKPEKAGYQKHMLRFRPQSPDQQIRVGDSIAEILMVNAHDTSTSYRFQGGLWRLVCANGLIVSELTFPGVRVPHRGSLQEILEASLAVAARLPELGAQVDMLKHKELTYMRQLEFARDAVELRYGKPDTVDAKDLLEIHRDADKPNDLWTTFNRVQENLSKGGQIGSVGDNGTFRRMRPIGGMNTTLDVNTRLWDLAMQYAA